MLHLVKQLLDAYKKHRTLSHQQRQEINQYFTANSECEELVKLIEWPRVSLLLSYQCSEMECKIRWQHLKQLDQEKKWEWTPQQDESLLNSLMLDASYMEDGVNWKFVADCVNMDTSRSKEDDTSNTIPFAEEKSLYECYRRWNCVLKFTLCGKNNGQWSEEEVICMHVNE